MRRLYTVLMYCLVPYIVLRLFWKSRHFPAYRHRINERFSLGNHLPARVDVWLHAVSLGEAVAVTPIIERMLANNLTVLVTTMTPTGSQHITTHFKSRVSHQYIPYDLPSCVRRFLKRVQPRIGIIMETELWPNLIYCANVAGIPLALVNARLSDHAFLKYMKIRRLLRPMIALFTWIGAQSELDAQRYRAIGAAETKVSTMGNMKFDLSVDAAKDLSELKAQWGAGRPVWIAASTHDDEEIQLLAHLQRMKDAIPGILLLIAPRRPERFQTVYTLVQQQGWRTGLRSKLETIDPNVEVIVLDSIGELMSFYAISDYAFVGASLVPIGGHNVLEPIAMGVPVGCGPYMHNAKSICMDLSAHQGLYQARSAADLADNIIALFQHPEQCQQQVARATQVLEANRGAIERYWFMIEAMLAKKVPVFAGNSL